MNFKHFDDILNHFNSKIQTIYSLIPLSELYEEVSDKNQWNRNVFNHNISDKKLVDKRPDLREISQMVIEMKEMTKEIKLLLINQKQSIASQRIQYNNDLETIERHCDHIKDNIPPFLQTNNKTLEKSNDFGKHTSVDHKIVPKVIKTNTKSKSLVRSEVNNKSTQEMKPNHKSGLKKVVRKDLENVPNITFITTEEFDSIPHYMLGRLTYERMNSCIANFNRTLSAKYKIIANYSNKYSDEEMRKYVKYKEQENTETEGQYFCTIGDLKELSDLKSEPTIRKIVTCLRHCKRIREIRGNPPKLVRYAVITNKISFN